MIIPTFFSRSRKILFYGNLFLARIGENWHTPPSFCALAFHTVWADRSIPPTTRLRLISYRLSVQPNAVRIHELLCCVLNLWQTYLIWFDKNVVNFGPVTREFCKRVLLLLWQHWSPSIIIRLLAASTARVRRCIQRSSVCRQPTAFKSSVSLHRRPRLPRPTTWTRYASASTRTRRRVSSARNDVAKCSFNSSPLTTPSKSVACCVSCFVTARYSCDPHQKHLSFPAGLQIPLALFLRLRFSLYLHINLLTHMATQIQASMLDYCARYKRTDVCTVCTDRFSGPGRAIGMLNVCVCRCSDSDFWTKWTFIKIFGMLV